MELAGLLDVAPMKLEEDLVVIVPFGALFTGFEIFKVALPLFVESLGVFAVVLEKFQRWGDCQDNIESRFSKDQLITNLMFYLVPGSVISSLWIYHASRTERSNPGSVSVPTGLARYPGEFYPMPSRRLASMAHNVVHWQDMPSGGHFAAMEEPALFAANLIDFASQF